MAFGDATNYGSIALADPLTRPSVVGIVAHARRQGVLDRVPATGGSSTSATPSSYGSLSSQAIAATIVAIAATPDGGGYWLAEANGNVARLRRRRPTCNRPRRRPSSRRVVGNGRHPRRHRAPGWPSRTAPSSTSAPPSAHGSLTDVPPTSPVTSIAAMPVAPVPSPLRYPAGRFGYDINWPQCAGPTSSEDRPAPRAARHPAGHASTTPSPSSASTDGRSARPTRACRPRSPGQRKANRHRRRALRPLHVPQLPLAVGHDRPAGTRRDMRRLLRHQAGGLPRLQLRLQLGRDRRCSTPRSQGASSPMWWLDIENDICGQYWSCDQTLNSLTIQGCDRLPARAEADRGHLLDLGAVAGDHRRLRAHRARRSPSGSRERYWTSPPYPAELRLPAAVGARTVLRSPKYAFAGGKTWLLQETPGPNNYPFDPDYAC